MTLDNIQILEAIRNLSESDWQELKQNLLKDGGSKVVYSFEDEEMVIAKLLKELGIPTNSYGYRYLKRGIILGLNTPALLDNIVSGLYFAIAEEYNTAPKKVERAIRGVIEKAWRNGNFQKIEELFSFSYSAERGKATNKEFIFTIVEYLSFQRRNKNI